MLVLIYYLLSCFLKGFVMSVVVELEGNEERRELVVLTVLFNKNRRAEEVRTQSEMRPQVGRHVRTYWGREGRVGPLRQGAREGTAYMHRGKERSNLLLVDNRYMKRPG